MLPWSQLSNWMYGLFIVLVYVVQLLSRQAYHMVWASPGIVFWGKEFPRPGIFISICEASVRSPLQMPWGLGSISHCQRYSAGTPYESVFSYFFSNVSMHTSSSRPPCTHVVSGNVFWRLRFRPFRARSFSFNPKRQISFFSSHPITYTTQQLT